MLGGTKIDFQAYIVVVIDKSNYTAELCESRRIAKGQYWSVTHSRKGFFGFFRQGVREINNIATVSGWG